MSRPPEVVLKEFIHDLGIIYSRGKYKNAHRSRLVSVAMDRWEDASARVATQGNGKGLIFDSILFVFS